MPMARSVDSDYIDLSLMGDFDMGIDLEGFEENVKKFIELPIKYLDSAHDKAVELIEDVHAMLWPSIPDGEVPNKLHETFEDTSNSNIIVGSSPTSVETSIVRPTAEVSTPSLDTMESDFTSCTDTDAHETESVLTKSPENTSSQGHTDANDLCILPEGTATTELYESTTSEEIILWNPEISAKPIRLPEPTTIGKDDYVPEALDTDNVTEQVGVDCSGHSDILVESSVFCGAVPLENSSENYEELVWQSANDPVEATAYEVSKRADNPNMHHDGTIKCVAMRRRNDQERMKNDEYYIQLRQNTSFKKMFMRNLSSKLRWSKQQTSVQHARSRDSVNPGYQLVSSSDDLDEDWEVVM